MADQGYWLLLPLLLLAALAFRRGGGLPLLALALCLPLLPGPAHAQDGTLWQRADQAAYARALEAVDAYRRGDFEAAGRIWEQLPGADAAYNRGNSLARAGHLQEALEAYDQALAQAPDMEDALANRRAVEEAMQRQPPTGGDDPAEGNGADDEGQPGEADPAPAGDDPGQDPEPRHGEDADDGPDSRQEQPSQAADTDDQGKADEALREQMQRALEQQEQGVGEAQAGELSPEAREREQREAAEAWLRRIPDDPGGLLRQRFRLEHERRSREGAD